MARSRYAKGGSRDPGGFVAIPRAVFESDAYRAMGSSARVLMFDIASQYAGDNNGRLVAGWKFMHEERGWRSKHTLIDACRELLSADVLVVQTRMGRFPSTAAWYACTWWSLDWCADMDLPRDQFRRGAYRQNAILGAETAQRRRPTGAGIAPRRLTLGAETAPVEPHLRGSPGAETAHRLDPPSIPGVSA